MVIEKSHLAKWTIDEQWPMKIEVPFLLVMVRIGTCFTCFHLHFEGGLIPSGELT